MKAEERKHLEHNTLAEGLGKISQTFQQGVPRGVWLVVGGLVVVVVLFYTWNHFSTKAQRENSVLWSRWTQLDSAGEIDKQVLGSKEVLAMLQAHPHGEAFSSIKEDIDLQRLETFVKENGGTVQGRLARFQLARLDLYEGLRNLGQDGQTRNETRKKLANAVKEYTILIKEARDIPVLHQEAILNCGKANESLGELSEAKKLYEQLRSAYPKSEAGRLAEQQLARLTNDADAIQKLDKNLQEVEVKGPGMLPPPPR